ncbi:MAG: SIMPL domain-containing protein [Candidatus Magasanikbacteria bacterium]|nr:SIMPL domain-containing protein [Candidatus Magasanikbacteria bacterium]
MNDSKIIPVSILGTALVVSALVFGAFYYSAQSVVPGDALSVTGSTKTRVTSDQAKLTINFARVVFVDDLASGYRDIAKDLLLTKELLQNSGIAPTDIIEAPVSMYQNYDPTNSGKIQYQLSQTITIQSNDVNKLTEISKNIPSLAEKGAVVSVGALEYYYSKLPDLRVSLLSEAVKDAKARAEKIAQGTDRHVGGVQSASSGVVQVMSPNSIDVADYGSYDTSSIEKDVMVTVKASFELR